MHLLLEIGIIFGLCLLGEGISVLLPFPIPGNIIGMLLLLLFLGLKWLKPGHVAHVGQFLLQNMAFFFVPAGVGIIKNYALLKAQFLPILFVCMVSTVITFGVTGLTAQWIIRYQKKKRGEVSE